MIFKIATVKIKIRKFAKIRNATQRRELVDPDAAPEKKEKYLSIGTMDTQKKRNGSLKIEI